MVITIAFLAPTAEAAMVLKARLIVQCRVWTALRCADGVVALKRRAARALSPIARIRLATRRRLPRQPSAGQSSVIRGTP